MRDISWKRVARNGLLAAALGLYLAQWFVNTFEAERGSWQGWAASGILVVYLLLRRRMLTPQEAARLTAGGAGTPAFGEAFDIVHGRRTAPPATYGAPGEVVSELVVERGDPLDERRQASDTTGA